MLSLKKLSTLLAGMFISMHMHAGGNSPVYPDAGSWNTFAVSYGLNKNFALLFTEELRLRENYSRLNLFYTNLGVEFKMNRYFKTSLVYRWIDKYQDEDVFSFRHRIMWDATVKFPYKKFTLAYRHRLQIEARNLQSSESGFMPETYSRNKFELSYDINDRLGTYISAELRYQFHDPRNIESEGTWHRSRFQGGFDYELSASSKCGIYYLIQREYNVSTPENLYITGLEYSLSLRRKSQQSKTAGNH